jgi:hypothetical protein
MAVRVCRMLMCMIVTMIVTMIMTMSVTMVIMLFVYMSMFVTMLVTMVVVFSVNMRIAVVAVLMSTAMRVFRMFMSIAFGRGQRPAGGIDIDTFLHGFMNQDIETMSPDAHGAGRLESNPDPQALKLSERGKERFLFLQQRQNSGHQHIAGGAHTQIQKQSFHHLTLLYLF